MAPAHGGGAIERPHALPNHRLHSFGLSVHTLNEMTRYNSLQAAEARSFGFEYVDLDAALSKTVEYYFDDCHFTDKGSERVADAVFPAVESLILSFEH
jgi:hypothetical protein